MATHLLLSRSRRLSQTLTLIRSLSSIITPVSYPVKAKPQPPPQDSQSPPQDSQPPPQDSDSHSPSPNRPLRGESGIPFTREEYRFVKDAPLISPVSYAAKVANLPEDRVKEEREGEADEEVRREGRRIEMDERMGRVLGLRLEEERLPFPTVVKKEKGAQKVVLELGEAIRQVKANAKCNFVETIEAHVNLGVDARRGDQMVRGALTLPHGTGKTVRVAVFAEGPAADEAREAGADVVGGDELIEEIRTGGAKLNFDKCIATPMFMPRLGKIGKILGPRGLMPNPKLGSVTSDVRGAVTAAKSGRLDFKIDKTSIVHVGLGKVNFSEDALRENIGAFVNALLVAKPVGLKKTSKYAGYVKNFTLSSTMGPGFPVSIQSLSVAADNYVKLHGK